MRINGVKVYSSTHLEANQGESWSARPSMRLLNEIMNREEDTARWVVILSSKGEPERQFRICLGDPVISDDIYNKDLFIPDWLMSSLSLPLPTQQSDILLSFEPCERIKKAKRLGFTLVNGSVPEGIDIVELLEGPLSQLGVLQPGQIIPLPIFDDILLIVSTCESVEGDIDNFVFLDGIDVVLEVDGESENEVVGTKAEEDAETKGFDFGSPMVHIPVESKEPPRRNFLEPPQQFYRRNLSRLV